MFRPNMKHRAKYYAVCFLNQIELRKTLDLKVANKLIDTYFRFFEVRPPSQDVACSRAPLSPPPLLPRFPPNHFSLPPVTAFQENMSTSEEEARLLSAVLTGVNRAFPFAESNDELIGKHIDSLFRITHQSTFNCSIQALMLLYQVMDAHQTVSDRFFRYVVGGDRPWLCYRSRPHRNPLLPIFQLLVFPLAPCTRRCLTVASQRAPSTPCTSTCCTAQ